MATWSEFAERRPELAGQGRRLLYQFGVGLAFLATLRPDGGPRLHPMCPIIHEGWLCALLIPSPKRRDLMRDRHYAMHSYPCEDNEDAFYLTGTAWQDDEPDLRRAVVRQFVEERKGQIPESATDDQFLFTFDIETVLLTQTAGHGDPEPHHSVWQARER